MIYSRDIECFHVREWDVAVSQGVVFVSRWVANNGDFGGLGHFAGVCLEVVPDRETWHDRNWEVQEHCPGHVCKFTRRDDNEFLFANQIFLDRLDEDPGAQDGDNIK